VRREVHISSGFKPPRDTAICSGSGLAQPATVSEHTVQPGRKFLHFFFFFGFVVFF
jgi:hypothetical protein